MDKGFDLGRIMGHAFRKLFAGESGWNCQGKPASLATAFFSRWCHHDVRSRQVWRGGLAVWCERFLSFSIQSMGLVHLPTFGWFFMVNVGKYTSLMDPMGFFVPLAGCWTKNRGKTLKMDGENTGKAYWNWWFGGKTPFFGGPPSRVCDECPFLFFLKITFRDDNPVIPG